MSDSGGLFTWNATLMDWDPSLPLTVDMQCACQNLTNDTDPCFAGQPPTRFDLGLHIGAIFIILGTKFCLFYSFSAASLLGVIFPLFIASIPATPVFVKKALYYGKFFGSGVILATGYFTVCSLIVLIISFVHVFPDACNTLQQPCLPDFFKDFQAAAGLFAMFGLSLP